ncbi:DUF4224 domain-containing protein [Sodalis sp. C49]|uniref:DUF4224 domain-containing protein n=1 Tax=Sodalis sp. C49 TaxID=3228929 RepID=UPI003965D24B
MKDDHDTITLEEMIEITGFRYKSKQCEVLKNAGIFFIKKADGHPCTTWGHFMNPGGARRFVEKIESQEPNFEAMD